MDRVEAHCRELTATALRELGKLNRLRVHGPLDQDRRSASVAFEIPGLEAHGLAKILSNRYTIMVRSGYHCAQPLHEELGINQTVRASFYLYNTLKEVHSLATRPCGDCRLLTPGDPFSSLTRLEEQYPVPFRVGSPSRLVWKTQESPQKAVFGV